MQIKNKGETLPEQGKKARDPEKVSELAKLVMGFGLIAILSLGIIAILFSPENATFGNVKDILSMLLPVIGAWVGTVLAFYFSKDNFAAATKSMSDMSMKLTTHQILESVHVKDKMIKINQAFHKNLPPDKIILTELLDELETDGRGYRIPILNDKNWPRFIVHRSAIDRFISDQARSDTPPNLKQLTLQSLLSEPELKKLLMTSFETIKEDDTLADAKDVMDRKINCQDLFVTKNGTKQEEVIGWITNTIISENAKV